MTNTNGMDKNQAGDQLGSCENNVSMFELFENHPDKETVEETHQTLSKNFIPGETFADIVNIIAQNNLMNAFVLSINKDDEIRLSSGFAMIKSGKGICLPKVMFTNFYPGRMEKPMLEKLPSEKESQLEGTTTKLPELAKIVECEDVDEIKDLFTNEALLATTMRNFVVLSPKLASSMASSGTESSRVEMLIEVVKELKDIKIVGSQTRSKNVMPKPIKEVLKFLSVLAMNEVNAKTKLPTAIEFKKSNPNELKLYLKEVKTTMQKTEEIELLEQNNNNNNKMKEQEDQSEDDFNETKKRPRDENKNESEESSDNKE